MGSKRKTVKHDHEMGELRELTFCRYRRLPHCQPPDNVGGTLSKLARFGG